MRALKAQTKRLYDTVYGCVRDLVTLGHLARAEGHNENGEHLYLVKQTEENS